MPPVMVFIILVLLVLTVFTFTFRALIRSWSAYREKMALLKRYENQLDEDMTAAELKAALDNVTERAGTMPRHDFLATGLFLTGGGIICVLIGRGLLRDGILAVGLDLGGLLAVLLGLMLALFGLAIRYMSRRPMRSFLSLQ